MDLGFYSHEVGVLESCEQRRDRIYFVFFKAPWASAGRRIVWV